MNLSRCERTAACAALLLLTLCGGGFPFASAQKRVARGGTLGTSRSRQQPPAGDDGRTSSYLDEGQRHADAGDWAAALKAYKQVTTINPRHPEAHMYIGDAYLNLGKYEEAFAAYKEAIRIAPSNAEAHYSLGEAYNYLDIYSAAIRPLVEATRLNPNYAEAHYGAGYAYLKQGDFKEALVYLKRAVRIRNEYPEAQLSIGLAYLGLGQTKLAEEQLKVLQRTDTALAKELDKEMRSTAARTQTDPASRANDTAAVLSPTVRPQTRSKPEPDGETLPASPSSRALTQKAESNPAMSPQTPSAQVQPAAAAAASPSSGASQIAAEITFWDSIKNSDNPAEFDAYLSKYPSGEFVSLARIRLSTLASKRDGSGKPGNEQKQEEAAARTTTEVAKAAAAPVAEPASGPSVEARREPTIDETLKLLKEEFSNSFTYTTTAPGEDANIVKVISEVVIEYEPLKFDNCHIEWRDRKDTLSVALSDLDPLGVQIEERSRPNTTFSTTVWNLTIEATGGASAIQELKGDGSSAVNNYNSLDLQFGNKEKADKLARLLQQAIKLCVSAPKQSTALHKRMAMTAR